MPETERASVKSAGGSSSCLNRRTKDKEQEGHFFFPETGNACECNDAPVNKYDFRRYGTVEDC